MSKLEKKTDKYLTQQHKLHWHLDRVSDWSKGKAIVPLYIDMGITQTCNIHCQLLKIELQKLLQQKI